MYCGYASMELLNFFVGMLSHRVGQTSRSQADNKILAGFTDFLTASSKICAINVTIWTVKVFVEQIVDIFFGCTIPVRL